MTASSKFEQLEMLSSPLRRFGIQLIGAMMLCGSILGIIGAIPCVAFMTAISNAMGSSRWLRTLNEAFILPIIKRFVEIIYKNPDDVVPFLMWLYVVFVIYPVLALVLLHPFQANLATFLRVALYELAVCTYVAVFRFSGIQHHEAHASWIDGGIVKPQWRFLFDRIGEYWLNPLTGIIPGMPSYAHVCVHHKYNSNLDDPQTVLWYNRSSAADFFLLYCPIALYNRHWAVGSIRKLQANRQHKFAEKLLEGQLRYATLIGLICVLNLKFFLFVMLPMQLFFTSAVSSAEWSMHAFLDVDNPQCTPIIATTTFAGRNISTASEPVHIVHHALNTAGVSSDEKAVEYKLLDSFLANRESSFPLYVFNFDTMYSDHGWGEVFSILIKGDFKTLAKGLVWTGQGPRPSEEELISFLKRSVQPLTAAKLEQMDEGRLKAQQLVGPANLDGKSVMKM